MKRVFALLMTLAVAITAIPTMEAKAAETKDITVYYDYYDENEEIVLEHITMTVASDATYQDVANELPTPVSTTYCGFIEWIAAGNTDMNEVLTNSYATFHATYTQYPIKFEILYVDKEDKATAKTVINKGYVNNDTTWGMIYDIYAISSNELSTTYPVVEWDYEYPESQIIDLNHTSSKMIADYKGYNIVELSYYYVEAQGEYGVNASETLYKLLSDEVANVGGDKLDAYFESEIAPSIPHMEGLEIVEWEMVHPGNYDGYEDNDEQIDCMGYRAEYATKTVTVDDGDEAKIYIATEDKEIPLPEIVNGRYVTWECDGSEYSGVYTVPADVTDNATLTPVYGDWAMDKLIVTLDSNVTEVEVNNENPIKTITTKLVADIEGYEPEIDFVYAYFNNAEGDVICMQFSIPDGMPVDRVDFQANTMCNIDMESGTYQLENMHIYFEDGTEAFLTEEDFTVNAEKLTIENNITDKIAPVISDIKMNVENGAKIDNAAGKEVVFTFKITDDGLGVNEDTIYVDVYHAMSKVGGLSPDITSLGNNMYQAAFAIDETFEMGDWVLSGITVHDKVGNFSQYLPECYGEDFYFCVTENGEYEPTVFKDIVLNFYDEEEELILTKNVAESPRRATISELIGEYPVYETKLGFLGWEAPEFDKMVIGKDTEISIFCDEQVLNFYPATEKKEIEVDLKELQENGESDWIGYESYFVNKDATYQDLLSMLPKPEEVMGCKFVKWDIATYMDVEWTDEISSDWVDLLAVYDNYPVTIERVYIDATGAAKKEEITKIYPAGTTMASICDEFAMTPSDASSSDVIKDWDAEDWGEEIVSLDNNVIYMEAIYDNKIFVAVDYDYFAQMENYGSFETVEFTIVVDKEMAKNKDQLVAYCKDNLEKEIDVRHYAEYGFYGWEYADLLDHENDGIYDYLVVQSEIKDTEVISVLIYVNNDCYAYVAEAGETLTLPWGGDEYYLEWMEPGEDGFNFIEGYEYTIPKTAVKGNSFELYAGDYKRLNGDVDTSAEVVDVNKVLPSRATLCVVLLEKGRDYNDAKELINKEFENIKNHAIYELTLRSAQGDLIEQLKEDIKVTIELPFEFTKGNILGVYRVDGDQLVECETTILDNKVSFVTDHFSTYVFVEQTETVNVPPTGDMTNVLPYMLLLLFGAGVFMVGNKRRNFVA